MERYELPPELNKKLINYCYEKMRGINPTFLAQNGVKKNLFMEILYDQAVKNIYEKGGHEVSDEELQHIFIFIKSTENILQGFIDGRNELIAINGEENLVFRVTKQLDY